MKIYLSAPVFTQVERKWNRALARTLTKKIKGAEVIIPQDFAFAGSFNHPQDFPRLFEECLKNLQEADVVVAVLDGADADSGTAFEVGYAHASGIPVIGVRTDYRDGQDRGLNVMLSQACDQLLREMSFGEDLDQLARDLVGKIAAAVKRANSAGR
jgi:nucleoside 2-deoxyribosyltransferase